MITVRALQSEEVSRAAAIMVENGTPWYRHGAREPQARKILASGLAEGAQIFGAADEADLMGWVWFETRGTFYHSGYIRIIVVTADHRHHGLGSALLATAEREIFSVTNNIFLLVPEWNETARTFYRQHGYRETGRLENYVRAGSVELVCWKSIGPIEDVPSFGP